MKRKKNRNRYQNRALVYGTDFMMKNMRIFWMQCGW